MGRHMNVFIQQNFLNGSQSQQVYQRVKFNQDFAEVILSYSIDKSMA